MQNPFLFFSHSLFNHQTNSFLTLPHSIFFFLHLDFFVLLINTRVVSPEEMQLVPTLCVFFLQLLLRGGASASAALAHSSRHAAAPHWLPATATWYGSPEGDGSSGGACGYGSLVDVKPLKARVGAVSPALFKSGEGCGACYKVRCLDKTICSKRAVTIIVTDQSPSGPSARAKHTHFDLSGAAFGHLAIPGHSRIIRNRGLISLLYRRTACKYRGKNIAFHVNAGSTAYWLSLLIEFEDGEGDIGSMHIRQAGSKAWIAMKHIWGANWCIVGGPLKGPLSVKLTTLSNNKTLSATDVIPQKWVPKATYTSRLNFSPVL